MASSRRAGCSRFSIGPPVGHTEDSAVHLGGTRHHVLHEVGVAGAVNVGVVPVGRRGTTCEELMAIPRSFSSGALSIWSKEDASLHQRRPALS